MMLIDHREKDSIKNHDWGFETRVESMNVGDYLIKRSIIIERKEINDFVGSLEQRLWEQLVDLEDALASEDNNINTAVLVIHGTVSDLNHHNMNKRKIDAIYGAIARILISYDVSVLQFREESQFINEVKKLHSKADTNTDKVKPHLSKRNFRDNRIDILYGIEGVGYETATSLLAEFNSIEAIVTANQTELQAADGIGPKMAERIHGILHDNS